MEENLRYVFDKPIKIGSTIDTQPLYFIQVIDLDESICKIPFNSYEITIKQLMQNYYDVSTCLHLIKNQIGFEILQGPLKNQYSREEFKLSSLNLFYDKPCFQVRSSLTQNIKDSWLLATISKIQVMQQQKQFPLEVYYNMEKFQVVVNLNDKISELKLKLIKQRPELKHTSKDMIKLLFGINVLSDQSIISDYKGLQRGSMISIVLRINEGCFRGHTRITLADKSCKRMDEIKIGDQILSYNKTSDIFEADEVTYIHRSYLQEEIILQLSSREQIHTTSNHLFMCSDKVYRKTQPNEAYQCLKVGTFLQSLSEKPCEILSIRSQILNPPQQFLHFFVKKNHNFIVNNVIAHNMFYEVYYQGLTQMLNLPQSAQILNIKKDIEARYQFHSAHSLKILHSASQLKNNSTLSDFGIKKQSRLTIVKRQPQFYNLLHPDIKVKTNQGIIKVGQLKVGHKLIQYSANHSEELLEITHLIKNNPEVKYCLTLQGNTEIFVNSLTYLQGQNGQAIIVEQIVPKIKNSNVFLRTADGQKIRVENAKKKSGNDFIHIVTQPRGSFIISSNLIVHGTVIKFVKNDQQQTSSFSLGLNPYMPIEKVQKILQNKLMKQNKEYVLTFLGKPVNKASSLSKQKIVTGDIVVILLPQQLSVKQKIAVVQQKPLLNGLMIDLIMPNGQKYPVDYSKYKNMTAKEVMNIIQPNYRSSFYFLVASEIILPLDTLSKIEMYCDITANQKIAIMVVKNAKLSFLINMNLRDYQISNISNIKNQQQASKISLINVKQQAYQYSFTNQYSKLAEAIQNNKKLPMFQRRNIFYTPLIYFFHQPYRKKMGDFMQNFQKHLKDETGQQIFKMVKSLFITIAYLPNLIPRTLIQTHFSIQKFRMAQFYKKGDTFYFYQYLITTNGQQLVRNSCGNIPSTIFHITSTTCKNVNGFSPQAGRTFKRNNGIVQEVNFIFYPFTYFVIDKIKSGQGNLIDQVWISEIASPISLQKDIILWVDDIPNNNSIAVKKILNTKQVQVLQLLSTIQAQKWLLEFGWLMNWKNINFKLISDNGRLQYKQSSDQPIQDYEAGLGLMNRIYIKRQLTVKSYIFCGDKQKVEDTLRTKPEYKLLAEKYNDKFKVTADGNEIIAFACSDQW